MSKMLLAEFQVRFCRVDKDRPDLNIFIYRAVAHSHQAAAATAILS